MALRLSEAELAGALVGLGPSERVELLQLLEKREQAEAAFPVDTRRPLAELAGQALVKEAERSGDPAAFLAADKAHCARHALHFTRLMAECAADPAVDAELYMQAAIQAFRRADEIAEADGFPAPRAGNFGAEPPIWRESDPALAALDVEWIPAAGVHRGRLRGSGADPPSAPQPPVVIEAVADVLGAVRAQQGNSQP